MQTLKIIHHFYVDKSEICRCKYVELLSLAAKWSWHGMETVFALLARCGKNQSVPVTFPSEIDAVVRNFVATYVAYPSLHGLTKYRVAGSLKNLNACGITVVLF